MVKGLGRSRPPLCPCILQVNESINTFFMISFPIRMKHFNKIPKLERKVGEDKKLSESGPKMTWMSREL